MCTTRSVLIWLVAIGCFGSIQAQHKLPEVRINGLFITDTVFIPSPGSSALLSIEIAHEQADTARYACKMEGAGNQWFVYQQRTGLSYHQLPGGTYRFIIRKAVTHTLIRKIRVDVEPLLWQKWWFLPSIYFFAFLILASALYFTYLYRLHQQVRLLNVRENIARDLHDDMGSYLSSISMLSQSVLNIAQKDPQQARLLVDKIGETARRVMDSMSDIVWSINPLHDSMAQIIVRMRDVAADLLDEQDVVFNLEVEESVRQIHLPLEQRHDFFLIYKEALTNMAKYAQATHVWVRLQRSGSALVLAIQDDGLGFNPDQPIGQNPLGGNGLRNMRARAEKMDASFTLVSSPGQGTTLTLKIILV